MMEQTVPKMEFISEERCRICLFNRRTIYVFTRDLCFDGISNNLIILKGA